MKIYVTAKTDIWEQNYDTGRPNKKFTKGKRYLVTDIDFSLTENIQDICVRDNKGYDEYIGNKPMKKFKL
jgi:hypothetical protein